MIRSTPPFLIRLRDGSTTTTHVVIGHSYRDAAGHSTLRLDGTISVRYRLSTGDTVDAEAYEIVPDDGSLPPLCDGCFQWLGRHRCGQLRLCENCWEDDALEAIEWHTSQLHPTIGAAVRKSAQCWISSYVSPGSPDHTSELPLLQSFALWLEQISEEATR